jgi:hypothetical protein
MLLPTLAGSGSLPAGGSADTPRGAAGNAGAPAAPPPTPAAGATMTGSVMGGIGRSTAAAPTPGTESITAGSEAGGSCISGTSGRPDGTSTAPPPPPPPPGAGRPGSVVDVDVVVSVVSLVVRVVVVSVVVVRLVVVDDFVVELVVEGLGGSVSVLPPPQPCAFPLLPSLPLPQLPLFGFSPLPGLSVSGVPASGSLSVLPLDPPVPSESCLGPLPGVSFACEASEVSGEAGGWATANAPPRPHRNRPDATRQADAAPCTREPTSSPPFKASTAGYSISPTILAQPRRTLCCCSECTRDQGTSIPPMIRTIVLGCIITALS